MNRIKLFFIGLILISFTANAYAAKLGDRRCTKQNGGKRIYNKAYNERTATLETIWNQTYYAHCNKLERFTNLAETDRPEKGELETKCKNAGINDAGWDVASEKREFCETGGTDHGIKRIFYDCFGFGPGGLDKWDTFNSVHNDINSSARLKGGNKPAGITTRTTINTTGLENIVLKYKTKYRKLEFGEYAQIKYSIDDGRSWNVPKTIKRMSDDGGWENGTVKLKDASNISNLKIRFMFYPNDTSWLKVDYMYIDNVEVTGEY